VDQLKADHEKTSDSKSKENSGEEGVKPTLLMLVLQ
jgi:hypothetical protein